MNYSTRFCHFKTYPYLKKGDAVFPGMALGIMGNSGQSLGAHVHIDSIIGTEENHWHVADFEKGSVMPANEQTLFCIGQCMDKGLFGDSFPFITAPIFSASYKKIVGKNHWGNDVVPYTAGSDGVVHWNRSKTGEVLFSGKDPGYGFSIIIGYKG